MASDTCGEVSDYRSGLGATSCAQVSLDAAIVRDLYPALVTLARQPERYREVFDLVYLCEAAAPYAIWQADDTAKTKVSPDALDRCSQRQGESPVPSRAQSRSRYPRTRPCPMGLARTGPSTRPGGR